MTAFACARRGASLPARLRPIDRSRRIARLRLVARLLLIIVLAAAAPARIDGLGSGIGLKKEAKTLAAPGAAFRNVDGRRLARNEAALRLVAQDSYELGAIVGLLAQRLVRDDDRGSRQRGRRDAVDHILRDSNAIERVLGVVGAVDRDRTPAQARIALRH